MTGSAEGTHIAGKAEGPGPDGDRYLAPGVVTRRMFNPFIAWLARRGIGVRGARVLAVRGRVSGEWRTVPVNPYRHGDGRYLVAPRGVTQWVRNLRVAGVGELRIGSQVEVVGAEEVVDDGLKVEVLRGYLAHWRWEVGQFFDGVGPDADDAELLAIVDRHPVFRIVTR